MPKIILIVILLLAGGFLALRFLPQPPGGPPGGPPQNQRGWGQKPEGVPETGQPSTTAKVPEAPKEKITVYKGFWMPCSFMEDSCQALNDAKFLKTTGTNIIGIAPNIKINSKGEISSFPIDFIEKRISDYAQKYYPEGIRIFISPTLDFAEDLNSRSKGEPRSLPAGLANKSGFMDKYNALIEEVAKLAEKYHIEMFSPMNEPDMQLGTKVSSSWGQEILPKIKKQYKGKVLWKAGLAETAGKEISFKGYDVLGLDFSAPGGPETESLNSYRNIVKQIVNQGLAWAKRDGVKEVAFTEFGAWGGAIQYTEAGKVTAHKVVFEEGQGKINGFIVLDPPPDLGDRSLKGSKTLDEIISWFQKL